VKIAREIRKIVNFLAGRQANRSFMPSRVLLTTFKKENYEDNFRFGRIIYANYLITRKFLHCYGSPNDHYFH
jgi:hypothetical protein